MCVCVWFYMCRQPRDEERYLFWGEHKLQRRQQLTHRHCVSSIISRYSQQQKDKAHICAINSQFKTSLKVFAICLSPYNLCHWVLLLVWTGTIYVYGCYFGVRMNDPKECYRQEDFYQLLVQVQKKTNKAIT